MKECEPNKQEMLSPRIEKEEQSKSYFETKGYPIRSGECYCYYLGDEDEDCYCYYLGDEDCYCGFLLYCYCDC